MNNITRSLTQLGCALSVTMLGILWPAAVASAEFPEFRQLTIDAHADEICYAVTAADVNNDQRPDIVVVTEKRVLWYESPTWKRHVILEGGTLRDNVCIAPYDIDGDGMIDFALGAGWTKTGTIQWLSRKADDPERWASHMIGTERWTHRMRFADVLGKGRSQLVVSPLNKTVGQGVRLTAFEIPENPRTDRWRSTIISENLNRMHNHWHADFDNNTSMDTLTASAEGISIVTNTETGFKQSLLPLVAGQTHSGAGEVKLGSSKSKGRFIASIEPMHGNSLVVYQAVGKDFWSKSTLVDDLARGHALWVADLDHDQEDEIVLGHSDASEGAIKGPGIFVFDRQAGSGKSWTRHTIDNGGIATEDALAVDLTGDGWVDIVACGRATHNVKLFINLGLK